MRERGEAAAAYDADRGQDETAAGRHNLLLCRSGEKEEITAWLFRIESATYTQFGLSWTKILKLYNFEKHTDQKRPFARVFYIVPHRLSHTKHTTLSMVYSGRLITAAWGTLDFLKIF